MYKLGDKFPETYFRGSNTIKKSFIENNDWSLVYKEGIEAMEHMIDEAKISDVGKKFCKLCFALADREFYMMPTSSTGKHHGGYNSPSNSFGGNIVHTKEVLTMADKVLRRYQSALGGMYGELAEALRIACILHDICKYKVGGLYTNNNHGMAGYDLITSVKSDYVHRDLIASAVGAHMQAWEFMYVWDHILTYGDIFKELLLVSFMLSECDFYSSH